MCLEKERVESKMKPRFLAKGVCEVGCVLGRESEGLIILGCLLREANEKKFSFRWIKS